MTILKAIATPGLCLLLIAGCATSQPTSQADGSADAESSQADEPAEAAGLAAFAAAAGTPRVVGLDWSADGELQVGYADGAFASVDAAAGQAEMTEAYPGQAPVRDVAPGGGVALVDYDPPVVVRLRDAQEVLRLTSVDEIAAGSFLPDGSALVVVEPSGKVHMWRQSEATLDEVPTKNLKTFMARQKPDFTVSFPALTDAMTITPDNRLYLGASSGTLLGWSPSAPESVATIVRLPAEPESLSASDTHLVATASDGSLRVVDLGRASFMPWSMQETGELVAASERLHGAFVVADGQTLALRQFEDGAEKWSVELPAGELCGLSLSPDASRLAVCVDGGVAMVDPQSGESSGAFRRAGDEVEWR